MFNISKNGPEYSLQDEDEGEDKDIIKLCIILQVLLSSKYLNNLVTFAGIVVELTALF
jgi:hypothetical protein